MGLPPLGGKHSCSGGVLFVWLPPDLHGFYVWVFATLKVLDEFISHVATARKDAAILSWKRWLHEDLSSRPYPMAQAWFGAPRALFGL